MPRLTRAFSRQPPEFPVEARRRGVADLFADLEDGLVLRAQHGGRRLHADAVQVFQRRAAHRLPEFAPERRLAEAAQPGEQRDAARFRVVVGKVRDGGGDLRDAPGRAGRAAAEAGMASAATQIISTAARSKNLFFIFVPPVPYKLWESRVSAMTV